MIETEGLDLVGILSSVDETAYVWDLTTGRIDWESNAPEILGVRDMSKIATGAAYHALIAPEHSTPAFRPSPAVSAPTLRVACPIASSTVSARRRRSEREVRVEDQGRWWPAADGHAVRARGVIRLLHDEYLEQQRHLARNDLDELTGQLNRMRLTEALGAVVARTERNYQSCAFLMISVNNLAVINETFGIEVGDQVIAEVGRRIREKLRGGDVIGRYSSNKFGLVMIGCGPGAMRIAAERFMKAVRDTTIKTSAARLTATISSAA